MAVANIGPDPVTYGWRDITGEIVTRGIGATDPSWTQIGASNFYQYAFALNDECWIGYHIPHDYVLDTDVYFHVHWMGDGTDVNPVRWQFDYMYAKAHDQGAFDTTGTIVTVDQAGAGTALFHQLAETSAVTISGLEPDGLIEVHLTRITNGAVDNSDTIFALEMDVHYQSTNLATLNREPDFYGS